jgi:hypothetical protein
MRHHISIAQLLAIMVPIAVGLTAIANPSAFWEGAIFVLTLILLFAAILGVIYRKGGARAFWLGFSLFGWGFYVLCSDVSFEFRSSSFAAGRYYWGGGEQVDHPVKAFARSLVDSLRANRKLGPKSVGEKIEVQWGGGAYYPSSVLEINEDQFKIRYESDPKGTYDEWVGINRIKVDGLDRGYRIGEMLVALLFATAGAIISFYFYATRKAGETENQAPRTVP